MDIHLDYTTCDRVEHRFENVAMAWWKGHTVIVPGVTRRNEATILFVARQLWTFAGQDPSVFDAAPRGEQLRFARAHVGRYDYVNLTVYPDDTVSYSTPTSGGGGHDLATYLVVDRKTSDIIPIGGTR